MKKEKYIVYIGDFDFRNENVQSFLVKNNGKIFKQLGYKITYIGINTSVSREKGIKELQPVLLQANDKYIELPSTLNIAGVLKTPKVCKRIITELESLYKDAKVEYVITYQCPTYAVALKKIAIWCKNKGIPYIVNCADLPIFTLQSTIRKIVMKLNWNYMHNVNLKYADGVISVSRYIESFYKKNNCKYVIIPPLFDNSDRNSQEINENKVASFIYAGTPFKITGNEADPNGMKDRLDKVIDIFAMISERNLDYKLTVVGISKEDYLSGVPRHKNVLSNNKSIVFLGRLSHRQTLELVANADFSVNYRDENLMTKAGFSTKIVESVSLGTPVIINDISDTFNYLEEGISGFKLTGNMDIDIDKLSKLCTISAQDRMKLKRNLLELGIFDIGNYKEKMYKFIVSIKG